MLQQVHTHVRYFTDLNEIIAEVVPHSCVLRHNRRSQHCEVEKRRRERMNRYMNELAQMIPTCAAVPRRLDKLSILKMAVDHMKTLRGMDTCTTNYLSLTQGLWMYISLCHYVCGDKLVA